MSSLLKKYIKECLDLREAKGAAARGARSTDAYVVLDILNKHFMKSEGMKFLIAGSAKTGSTSADLEVAFVSRTTNEIPEGDSVKLWHFEVKSFGRNDIFKIEMTNPQSLVRKTVLRQDAKIGTPADVESQLRKKISAAPEAVAWVVDALKSPQPSRWAGTVLIHGDPDERSLSITSGTPGDWSRLRAIGGSGTPRDIFTISNVAVRAAEREAYDTDELEEAIQQDFVSKGDEVLLLFGQGAVRCFSLTEAAQDAFGFPMFSSLGNTIKPQTAFASSFGGGGRIGTTVEINEDAGLLVR